METEQTANKMEEEKSLKFDDETKEKSEEKVEIQEKIEPAEGQNFSMTYIILNHK